jgi:hypothetical protein
MYYKYLDLFKVRPETVDDLFDYLDYIKVDSSLQAYQASVARLMHGGS